jgi:hypothetical protein
MYPNPALPAWELAIMAIVPVMALVAWLTSIYLAARDTGGHKQAVAGSPPEPATAGTGSRSPSVVSEPEPGRPPADRTAA